jgi:hypothetical protein
MNYQINKNRNTNQNANKRDKYNIYKYKYGEECIVKRNIISKDWKNKLFLLIILVIFFKIISIYRNLNKSKSDEYIKRKFNKNNKNNN